MTSANFFNGYAVDKPTSRVMAPPGGRSNNIFGGYDEPTPQPKNGAQQQQQNGNGHHAPVTASPPKPQLTAQQEAAANKMHQNGGINLFESVATNGHTGQQQYDAHSITQSHRGAGIKPKDNSQSNIFGGYDTNPVSKPVDRQKSTVFEDEKPPAINGVSAGHSNKPRSGYNTITGQTYEDEQTSRVASAKVHVQAQAAQAAADVKTAQHTSSRVLQPPGGRSTGLW